MPSLFFRLRKMTRQFLLELSFFIINILFFITNKLKVAARLEISWLAASDLDFRPGDRGSIPGAAVMRPSGRRCVGCGGKINSF